MEKYPWWTEGQKRLADEVEDFADEVLPRVAEAVYLKEHPRDILRKIAEKGWFGVLVPEEYGGMGKNGGVTGCCIISEGLCKAGFIGGLFFSTMFGGVNQLVNFGTDEQKERWLPRVAKGELLGAIALTEPFVGSDAGGVMTRARREGDEYVINGKKRFVSNTGVADVYLVYARTSDDPADVQSRRHMTAFIVEKGTPGFSVEKVNELAVFDGVRNGVLDFNDVRVPAENVVGGEGNGWNVMINGLNFERLMIAVGVVAGMREAIRYSLFFTERRVQFGLRTIDFESNQYKIADMIIRYQTARLMTYYTAYLMDQGLDPSIESNVAKIYATEACREAAIDALQVAGGDAFTKFYPIEMVYRDAKISEVGAGTNEVLRRLITGLARRRMAEEFKPPKRRIHPTLRIPIPYFKNPPEIIPKPVQKDLESREGAVLEVLAVDYFVNPGLHMKLEELGEETGLPDDELIEAITSLERKNLVHVWRDWRGRARLVKATYEGLRKAKPPEFYKWFPPWSKEDEIF